MGGDRHLGVVLEGWVAYSSLKRSHRVMIVKSFCLTIMSRYFFYQKTPWCRDISLYAERATFHKPEMLAGVLEMVRVRWICFLRADVSVNS